MADMTYKKGGERIAWNMDIVAQVIVEVIFRAREISLPRKSELHS